MKTKITSKKFTSYQEMAKSAKNWDHHCSYTLLPSAYNGEHYIIELPNAQLSYSYREGGFMHETIAPAGCISIAVIQSCSDKACFDTLKLHQGMILFADDSTSFNFMSKGTIGVAILSVSKDYLTTYSLNLEKYLRNFIEDDHEVLSNHFDDILKKFLDDTQQLRLETVQQELIQTLGILIKKQTLHHPSLTKGEKIALAIRDKVYHHMDGKIRIETFAKEYEVSGQTLINAFKSLFGFTPKHFLQLLKLNLAHHDLQNADYHNTTVLEIASKWGFSHMGRFSEEYTILFGKNPSLTLKSLEYINGNMISTCTSRQEEMI